MADDNSVDVIRARMEQIRRNLGYEVDGIVDNARLLVDWRHYVRRYPWPVLGAAALAGYLLVPRPLQVSSPDVKTLEKLAKRHELVVAPRPEAVVKPSLMDKAVTFAGSMLLRAITAYVGQQVGKLVGTHTAEQSSEPSRQTREASWHDRANW